MSGTAAFAQLRRDRHCSMPGLLSQQRRASPVLRHPPILRCIAGPCTTGPIHYRQRRGGAARSPHPSRPAERRGERNRYPKNQSGKLKPGVQGSGRPVNMNVTLNSRNPRGGGCISYIGYGFHTHHHRRVEESEQRRIAGTAPALVDHPQKTSLKCPASAPVRQKGRVEEGSDCLIGQAGSGCPGRWSRRIALRIVISLRATATSARTLDFPAATSLSRNFLSCGL